MFGMEMVELDPSKYSSPTRQIYRSTGGFALGEVHSANSVSPSDTGLFKTDSVTSGSAKTETL